jgi:hypothetical protein
LILGNLTLRAPELVPSVKLPRNLTEGNRSGALNVKLRETTFGHLA